MQVNVETKFNVGDFVVTREAVLKHNRTKKSKWDRTVPNPFQVVEVAIQFCYANCVQVHYRLRAIDVKGMSTLWDLTEPELELYKEEDYAITEDKN